MHRKSRVSSAIPVAIINKQDFNKGFTPVAAAQWDRCGSSSHKVVYAGISSPGWRFLPDFFTNDFFSVLLGLMDLVI